MPAYVCQASEGKRTKLAFNGSIRSVSRLMSRSKKFVKALRAVREHEGRGLMVDGSESEVRDGSANQVHAESEEKES